MAISGYPRGLCQEDEKSSCCTKDEGGPFGAALSSGCPLTPLDVVAWQSVINNSKPLLGPCKCLPGIRKHLPVMCKTSPFHPWVIDLLLYRFVSYSTVYLTTYT